MSDIHNKELYDKAVSHFNEPAIVGFELCRLIGYGETGVDCYFIFRKSRGEIFWNTCVGGYTWLNHLKEQNYVKSYSGEDWDDFFRLNNTLALNGCPKEKEFMLVINHNDMENLKSISP